MLISCFSADRILLSLVEPLTSMHTTPTFFTSTTKSFSAIVFTDLRLIFGSNECKAFRFKFKLSYDKVVSVFLSEWIFLTVVWLSVSVSNSHTNRSTMINWAEICN